MNNISIAKETIKITKNGGYILSGKEIRLIGGDHRAIEIYSPERGAALVEKMAVGGELCRITTTAEDSFQAARRYFGACVLNFANAHHAGGGFLLGANAQEESLCRCSTLYASISSKPAAEMYHFNNTHPNAVESDYMLYSPDVCVFRDHKYNFLEEPFSVSVITAPAPNRRGAAMLASSELIEKTFVRRIRILLAIAAEHGHKDLVLGAWGCGAFGNRPDDVSEFFRTVLIDEGFGRLFDEVCFAVYGSEEGKNYRAFKSRFAAY